MGDKWIARDLPGGIYCAPRCGHGCTRSDYEIAMRRGAELAAILGAGWEPRIWENLGWHYEAEKGVAKVMPHENRNQARGEDGGYPVTGYTAFINSAEQVIASGQTAEDALGFAVQDARTIIARMNGDLADLLEGTSHD